MAMAVTYTSSMHPREWGKGKIFYIKTKCFMKKRGSEGAVLENAATIFSSFYNSLYLNASIVRDFM